MFDPSAVAAWDVGSVRYPDAPPFHPDTPFLEYPFGGTATGPANPVYTAMRALLHGLGLDAARFETPAWNPLGGLVQPGGTVIVKPNFVVSEHPDGLPGIQAAVVHGSVLRPIIDYLLVALQGRGRIVIADSPIKEVDFDRIVHLCGIDAIKAFYDRAAPGLVELLDFRDAQVTRNASGFMVNLRPLPGDPAGYTLVDLGSDSLFEEIAAHAARLRSTAVYYEDVMEQFHRPGHNVYSLPNTLLRADAVVSVAKLKTHRKGGITMTLKNAVGITNEKRGLPHHRAGAPSEGGDAVADGARLDARLEDGFRDFMLSQPYGRAGLRLLGGPLRNAARIIKPVFRSLAPGSPAAVEGDWYGNDTVWRMALDLNRVLFFADRAGALRATPQRSYLGIVDGVVAGEGEGPLFPTPKPCGVLLGGAHPVLVDIAAARLMGYDWRRIPMLREAVGRPWPLRPAVDPGLLQIFSNQMGWSTVLQSTKRIFFFEPTRGWKGHIELTGEEAAPQ